MTYLKRRVTVVGDMKHAFNAFKILKDLNVLCSQYCKFKLYIYNLNILNYIYIIYIIKLNNLNIYN